MDNKTIRRANLAGLLSQYPSDAEFARRAGVSDRLISQIKNGTRELGDRLARKLETALHKPGGWFDVLQFHSDEGEASALEAAQIVSVLESDPEALKAWIQHGRLLVQNATASPHISGRLPGRKAPRRHS